MFENWQLKRLTRFVEREARSDEERDRRVIVGIRTIIENQEANDANQIAIGKILFARFNNVDEQLDRIEEKLSPAQPSVQVIAVITAVRPRRS